MDEEDTKNEFEGLSLSERIEKMHSIITEALSRVYANQFILHHSDRYAALALCAQMELAKYLSQMQFNAKQSKQAVKYTTGEVSYELRSNSDKKQTEEAIKQLTAKDIRIRQADLKQAELEMQAEQWGYVFESLRDAHIFFRNLGK